MSSMACCGGFVDEGDPSGKVEEIKGFNKFYDTGDQDNEENKDKLIVIATDVFGYTLNNVRLLADSFSKELKIRCIIPDMFQGSEPPGNLMDNIEDLTDPEKGYSKKLKAVGRIAWYFPGFIIRNPVATNMKCLEEIITEFRTNHGIKRVYMIGYCWGGAIAALFAQRKENNKVADVCISNHPGNLSFPNDIEKICTPIVFVLTPDKDNAIKHPQAKLIQEILLKKSESEGLKSVVKNYANMPHGFAVRGNAKDPTTKELRLDAFNLACTFIKENL